MDKKTQNHDLDTTEPTQTILVGCDDGHDSIKLEIAILTAKGGVVTHIERSQINMPSKVFSGVVSTGLSDQANGVYSVGNEKFTVSDVATGQPIDTRSINYAASAVNKVLVCDAMMRAGLSDKEVSIVSGLPISSYYDASSDGSQVNKKVIEEKRANLLDGMADVQTYPKPSSLPKITAHSISPEGIAAIYDMAIADDGSDVEAFFNLADQAPVGVLDIGGKTIDMAVVNFSHGGLAVDMQRTTSINFGMLRLQEALTNQLAADYEMTSISPRVLARVIKNRKLIIAGQEMDATESLQRAVNRVLPEFFNGIQSKWGKAIDLGRIIVVGGGAYTFFESIKDVYPQAVMPEKDAEFANARGFLKLALRKYLVSTNS